MKTIIFVFLLVVSLSIENTVAPLSPNYVNNFQMPINSGGANIVEQNLSTPQNSKMALGRRKLSNENLILPKKFENGESKRKVSVPLEQIATEQNSSSMAKNVPETFLQNSLPFCQKENSFGQYLAELFNYYLSAGFPVPPNAIAKILLRMRKALEFYFLKRKNNSLFLMELPYPLTLENFRVDKTLHDSSGMSGSVNISFVAECKVCNINDLTLNRLFTMSPQQISEMRLKSDKSDIDWFFGSVLHLLLYQTYPLEQWMLRNNHQFGGDLTKLPNFEFVYMSKLQESVKELLESEGQLQIRNDLPRGFQKQYAFLGQIMKNALQTYSDTRTYDENQKMLKLASEF
uniref:Uncharacterized protein n=1 Tax=Globodera rostochiensis TaxID=31243 RepID=A0A914HY08_GLORO